MRRLSLTVAFHSCHKDNDFSVIARASQEILLYLHLLSQDSTTYCEGVFHQPNRKSGQFSYKAWVGRLHFACLNDYVDWWPSCHYVLHIERVWSTIVSFCFAFVQNVRWKLRKWLHTFVCSGYNCRNLP